MRIVLQLTPDASGRLRQHPRGVSAEASRERGGATDVLGWLSHEIVPMHSKTTDRSLDRFYLVEVSDREEAARVVKQLQDDPNVESAYIKPADAMP